MIRRILLLVALASSGCGTKTVADAEAKRDVTWLSENPSPDAVAALGRLADKDEKAVSVLDARGDTDLNVYIAAWTAVTRDAPWGMKFLKTALANPTRAELAGSSLPRKDTRVAPLLTELEGAIVRLAAGRAGSMLAGLLASVGPTGHAHVERRLTDAKTRGPMCDGIGMPDASGDAKSTLLAVPAESRDHASCIRAVIEMAATEDSIINWLAVGAEPGLLGAVAKDVRLPCTRLAIVWKKALTERQQQSALVVPLQASLSRCTSALDGVMGDLLVHTPRARQTIVMALNPYGTELANMKDTCAALKSGNANSESPIVRERANDAIARSCQFAQ